MSKVDSAVRKDIESMRGYSPGEQPGQADFLKLNTNENPFPPTPQVLKAIQEELANLRLYPEPMATPLREKAAEVYDLKPEQVLVGNGSDELLAMLTRVFLPEGSVMAIPVPTYSLYEVLARIRGASVRRYPFREDFSLPDEIFEQGSPLTVLNNPNSPSGTLVELDEVARLAESVKGVLVVDEAYVDFASDNALPLLEMYDNVVILRTLSKSFSLAGMRIGLAFASSRIISLLAKVKDSYNVSRLAIRAGIAALDSIQKMRTNVAALIGVREVFVSRLREMDVKVFPSEANFVMVRLGEPLAEEVFEALKERKILVRYFDEEGLSHSLRISIGTESQMDTLFRNIKETLNQKGFLG